MDSVDIDMQPLLNHNKLWMMFFILFVVLGGFFVVNLFAGVVVDVFNKEKDRLGGLALLT